MCGFTLPGKSWQSNGRQTDRMFWKKPGEINRGVFHLLCFLCTRVSFLVFWLASVCVGVRCTPLATSAPELCDARPAGAAAPELCPSRSEGNWVVFLQGIYSQRRKHTETPAPDGSINMFHRENSLLMESLSIEEDTAVLSFHLFIHSSVHMSI